MPARPRIPYGPTFWPACREACVRAPLCVRARAGACVRACGRVRACVRACVSARPGAGAGVHACARSCVHAHMGVRARVRGRACVRACTQARMWVQLGPRAHHDDACTALRLRALDDREAQGPESPSALHGPRGTRGPQRPRGTREALRAKEVFGAARPAGLEGQKSLREALGACIFLFKGGVDADKQAARRP